jgi:hypothetical protein
MRPGAVVRVVQSKRLPDAATLHLGQIGLVVDFYTHPLYTKGYETDLTQGNWYTVMVDGKIKCFRGDYLELA